MNQSNQNYAGDPQQRVCPNCGHCPNCGRSYPVYPTPYVPYVPWTQPWTPYPTYPNPAYVPYQGYTVTCVNTPAAAGNYTTVRIG